MSRQTQSYDDKAIRGEELESLATSIAQKIVDNGQVVAEALDELDARTRALENRNPDVLGDAVADSLDAQVLKIGGQPIDTSAYELLSNKVSSWQGTPDNTHYPSEKLVKDGLDAKVDIANIDLDGKTTTILAEVQALATKGIHYARFYTRGDGGAANISDKPVSGSGFLCEVLCNRFAGPTNYRYLVTCWVTDDKNPYWTYVISSTASITWSRLNAFVPDTPTNNNLVAMDANGRIKDSGLSKSSVESAITAAGSAIQGVKVNNTTLTPDANKVVTVPLATTSADGAMSAADKTKLNNATTYTQSSGTAPVKVDAYGALTPVPMDSTPTASSTNLMTSGDIKTALDLKAPLASPALTGTPTAPTAASGTNTTQIATTAFVQGEIAFDKLSTTGGFGTTKLLKLFEVAKSVTTGYGTCVYIVRYSMANNATIDSNGSGTIELRIRTRGTSEPLVSLILKEDAGKKTSNIIPSLKYYKKSVNGGLNIVVAVNAGSTSYEGLGYKLDKAFSNGGSNMQSEVTMAARDTVFDPGQDYIEVTKAILHYNEVYYKGGAVGSPSAPVYVDANGELAACTDDFVHDAEIAKMVQVKTAGTAAGSSLQPVYVDTSGVATAIDYKKWNSERRDSLNALPSDWYKSGDSFSIPSGNTVKYVELSGLNSIGGMDLWVMCNATNRPCMIRARFNVFRYGRSGIQILDRSGYDDANINRIIIRTNSTDGVNPNFDEVKIYFRITNSDGTFAWRCSETRTNSNFSVLTETEYNALTSVVACSANCTRVGATSISSRHIQRGSYDVLDTGDVAQTYSSTSEAPISGKGVAAALATSLTDVEYVAAQSGGGGSLNKTKNGSTTSVLAFMTTDEATSLWQSAWAAAN